MLIECIIAGIIVVLLAVSSYILLRAAVSDIDGAAVEIIIDGDVAEEELEHAVIAAKAAADRYFRNCDIYIRGGEEKAVEALCRTHGVLKKEL